MGSEGSAIAIDGEIGSGGDGKAKGRDCAMLKDAADDDDAQAE